jgi:hypothetical protein
MEFLFSVKIKNCLASLAKVTSEILKQEKTAINQKRKGSDTII